jgi:hypothetical protein
MKIAIQFIPEQPVMFGVTNRQIFHGRAPLPLGRRPRLRLHRADQPHCWWQKAAISGKFPATKGVILRQVHCRLLSLFAAPVLPWIFPKRFR